MSIQRPKPVRDLNAIAPYHHAWAVPFSHPERQFILKLDCNEATYPPSPLVKKCILDFVQNEPLQWYPDTTCHDLRETLSGYVGLSSQHVSVFNGCDHALETLCRTYLQRGDEVAVFSPTYDNFRVFAESCGGVIRPIFARSPFESNIDGLTCTLNSRTRLVYLSNPTNPSGLTYGRAQIVEILEKCRSALVIVDEAYFEFWGHTSIDLIGRYSNLIVTRSFSKAFALAGLRCGYVVSDPGNIRTLETVRNGKNVNSLAQIAAAAALSDLEYYEDKIRRVRETSRWLVGELEHLNVAAISTPSNYILIKVADPKRVEAELISRNVFVRNRSLMPQLEGFLRITVGLRPEMEKFLEIFGRLSPKIVCIADPFPFAAACSNT
jgi:histidinol-phosphate aminotransferase